MSEDLTYGYNDDSPEQFSNMQFGLNSGVVRLSKFEYTPNGGKGGAAQPALDIVFSIDEKPVSYRLFPVTKAFDKDQQEVTDPRHPAMQKAMRDLTSVVTHILSTFVSKDVIKTAMAVPIKTFQEYCDISAKVLPVGYENIPLDMFLQWQWNITANNDKTYLRIPSNMKHGLWLCQHIEPVGSWKPVISSISKNALSYTDDAGNVHPFVRTKWFMDSNFATQQKDEDAGVPAVFNATADDAPTTPSADGWGTPPVK